MKTYPLFKVHISTDEALAQIRTVFESGYLNEGVQVAQLTEQLKKHLHTNNLVLTNSCTSALTLALHLCGVGEVITTPMTCVATNVPIVHVGSRVVWADVDPETGMIDPDDVKERINSNTKAVIAVAWAGTPPELELLWRLCKGMGVKLILDAAHAFGASYKGKSLSEWADYVCYSFQAIKHFTTGDGGALSCHDPKNHERAKALKWFGLDRDKAKDERGDWKGQQWDVDIASAGFKFNMNNVSAAIGLSQLSHIDAILAHHTTNASCYDSLFHNCETVVPAKKPRGSASTSWVYTMKVVPQKSSMQRDELLKALNAEGIMAGVVHVPNDDYTCFKSSNHATLPGVREFSGHQFSIPVGWWLEPDDVKHIATRVKELTK